MTALKYVGRRPDSSDYAVMNKGQVEAAYDAIQVDESFVIGAVQDILPALASLTYVNAQDSLLASRAAVLAADSDYVSSSQNGASNGVVPLDSSGSIPLNRLPSTFKTSRPVKVVSNPTVYLNSYQTLGSSLGTKKFLAAALQIPDPGYPYIPLPFAVVQGGARYSTDSVTRSQSSSNFGQITALDSNNVRYGWTICGGRTVMDFHQCLPFADSGVNPTTRSMVEGPMTLNFWLGLYAGSTYTFTPFNPLFYALCFPGIR